MNIEHKNHAINNNFFFISSPEAIETTDAQVDEKNLKVDKEARAIRKRLEAIEEAAMLVNATKEVWDE